MKSFVRWCVTVSIVGSTLLGSSLIGNMKAIALPEAQVLQKLEQVPVFTVTDEGGAPLVASVKNSQDKDTSVAGIFISQQDAQSFIDRLKTQNPELAKKVKVSPVSLADVYKLEEANQNKPDGLHFAYVPVQHQVETAVAVLKQGGQKVENFQGVPLFVAKAGKDKGYLTIQQDNKQFIPFFFDKEQLQAMIDRFKKEKPDLASTVEINVVTLQGVIDTLRKSDNQQLTQIVLFPSQESLAFLRTLPSAPAANQSQPKPR